MRSLTILRGLAPVSVLAITLAAPLPVWAQQNQQHPPTAGEVQENAQQDLENNPDALQTAEDTAAAEDTQPNGDVAVSNNQTVVTATRRREALSDVPLAVSAVTAQTLENSGVTDIRQLNQVSPSLFVSSATSEAGGGTARIRGIGTVGENPGLESSVAVFIDGVYRNRSGSALTELGEVDRIEVLRGPQGTLFGRNASAGLISVITAKPKFNLAANGEATFANWGERRFIGGVTGPVTDKLALRMDGVYYRRHGTLKDLNGGRKLNNRNRYLLRGQALWEASDRFNFRLIGDYAHRKEYCCGATFLEARDVVRNPASASGVSFQPSSILAIERGLGGIVQDNTYKRRVAYTSGVDYTSRVRDWGVSGEGNLELGKSMNLTSITAYRQWKWRRGQDADYNTLDIGHRMGDGGAGQQFKTFTQELRLQGTTLKDRLDWLFGGFFSNERLYWKDNLSYGTDFTRYANCVLANNLGLAVGAGSLVSTSSPGCMNQAVAKGIMASSAVPASVKTPVAILSGAATQGRSYGLDALAQMVGLPSGSMYGIGLNDHYRQTSRNWALFTHNKLNITDRLALTVGVRYTNERKKLNANLEDNNRFCNALRNSALAGLSALPCSLVPSIQNGTTQGSYVEKGYKKREHRWTGTVNLSYKPVDRVLTYASFSKGYKAGGFNLDRSGLTYGTPSLRQLEFAPETVDAWEMGAKWGSRMIDVNVALFYQKFRDFQLNTYNGVNFVVENISRCKGDLNADGSCDGKRSAGVISKGIEIETFMRPTRYFGVNVSATIADTKYRHNLVGQKGRALPNALSQLPGNRLSNAPRYTLTTALNWHPPIGNDGWSAIIYIDDRYQSEFNTGSDLDAEKLQNGFHLVNARIGLRGPKERWAIEFWGQNVFNKRYKQVAFDSPLQGGAVPTSTYSAGINNVQDGKIGRSTQLFSTFLGEPRVWGVTARVKY